MDPWTDSTSGTDIAKFRATLTIGALNANDLGKRIAINHPDWGMIEGTVRHISHSKVTGSSIMTDNPDAQLTLPPETTFYYA